MMSWPVSPIPNGRRLRWLLVVGLLLPALACNLDNGAVTVATVIPGSTTLSLLNAPLVGINPISGPPGTALTLTATGFAVGTQLSVFISTLNTPSSTPATVLTANAGANVFVLPVPQQLNGVAVAGGTPLLFTVAPVTGGTNATALFWVQGAAITGQVTATTQAQVVVTSPGVGATSGVFITSPAIDSAVAGTSVAVTGSAPAGAVVVQVHDANNAVLGSVTANSQATTGALGVWQTTVGFTPPAGTANGFIVAIQGGIQASIPIVFSDTGVSPALPTQTLPATLMFATPTPGIQIQISSQ